MILECLCVGLLVTLLGSLLVTGARNREKLQFFKKKCPNLPVLENPSLFGGHANALVHGKYNWSLIENEQKRLGPFFGFFYGSKPVVATTDLDFIKSFIIDQTDHINRLLPDIPFTEFEVDNMTLAVDEQWIRLRRLIGPAFSAHKIKSANVRAEISGSVEKLLGMIESRLNEAADKGCTVQDVENICNHYTMDTVFSCFYKQNNLIDFKSGQDKYVEIVETFAKKFGGLVLKASTAFPSTKPFFSWLIMNFDDQGVMFKTIMNLVKQQTRQHIEATRQAAAKAKLAGQDSGQQQQQELDNFIMDDGSRFKRNMVDYIIDQYRAGKMTEREYYNSTNFLLYAANKTVADAISKCLHLLACNQDAQEKLRQSILAEGDTSEYLNWCIHESLRLFPPVLLGCSRILKRDMPSKVGPIPAGTFVLTLAYTIGRLTEYWGPDANEFRPERWANSKNFHPCQFLSFGIGKRSCPGRDLALLETKMLLDALMRRYKFEKCQQTDEENRFTAPLFMFLVYDKPTYLKISRL